MNASYEMLVFCQVVDLGSFAAAARELGLSPSAVSKIVSRTEDRLGVRLLTRTTRKLALSAEGETYLSHARQILSAIADGEAEVMQSSTNPSGLLRVNCGTIIARHQLAKILPEFLTRFPGISLELGVTDRQVDLLSNHIDVSIRAGPLVDSALIVRKIGDSSRVICASPGYLAKFGRPKTPEDLAEHNCLSMSGNPNMQQWAFATPEGVNRLSVSGNFRCDNADVLLELGVNGHGIIRLALLVVKQDIDNGNLVKLFEDAHVGEEFPISALMQPGRYRAPRVKVFVDFLVEKLGHGKLG